MTVITMRIAVAPDGTISGRASAGQLPPGEHDVSITLEAATPKPPNGKPFTMNGFPIHNVLWDGSISLHREDMYDDEGRLR